MPAPGEFCILINMLDRDHHGYVILQNAREPGGAVSDVGIMHKKLARMATKGFDWPAGVASGRQCIHTFLSPGKRLPLEVPVVNFASTYKMSV